MKNIPYLHQWSGVWAMEPAAFNALKSACQNIDLAAHLREASVDAKVDYEIKNGIATVPIRGSLQKHQSSMGAATSTVLARQVLKNIAADESVDSVILHIESPGGTVAGTRELAEAVRDFPKPIHAFIEDLCASAAYWIASQADTISINPSGLAGSIGTYAVVEDLSEAASMNGVKVHVVKAGKFKAMGAPGTEITDEQLAELQRIVDSHNEMFVSAVESGRKMSRGQVISLADGRMHPASEAVTLGLVDFVRSMETLVEELSNSGAEMASIEDYEKALPGASAEFILKHAKAETPIDKVSIEHMNDLALSLEESTEQHAKEITELKASHAAEIEAKNKELAELKQQKLNQKASTGVAELETEPSAKKQSASASEQFGELVEEALQNPKTNTKAKAINAVAKANPELHAKYIQEVNNGR